MMVPQQQGPMDPATTISITLPAGQWDQVLDILGNGPWKVVNSLIQKIVEQAQAQGGAAMQTPAPNGHLPAQDVV